MSRVHVLIVPDKFKGTLTATEVSHWLSHGITASAGDLVSITSLPLADGGDGSVAAALSAGYDPIALTVRGPTGEDASTTIAYDGSTAIVEVATTCGLAVLPGGIRDPLGASSQGLGHAIRYIVEQLDVRRIVLALGGSASTDGGSGMLAALGARFLDQEGFPVAPNGGNLGTVSAIDLSSLIPLAGIELVAATDVRNPLTGPDGAAAVFGPQKGATSEHVSILDAALAHLVTLSSSGVADLARVPGAGSAGGIGYASLLLGGRIVSGADFFLDLLDFDTHVASADLVITGEGSMDAQTREGKLVSVVARRAAGRPVVAVVGRNALDRHALSDLGITAVHTLSGRSDADSSRDAALSGRLLEQIGRSIGADLPAPSDPRETWRRREATAEAMIPIIGTLHRDHGVVVSIHGQSLINNSAIGVIKAHRYARHATGTELQVEETLPLLQALLQLPVGPSAVDIARLAVAYQQRPHGTTAEGFLTTELGEHLGGDPVATPASDVVLYGFGRIGRLLARVLLERASGLTGPRLRAIVVRKGSAEDLVKRASLLRRDSVHGPFAGTITVDKVNDRIIANGTVIQLIYSSDPATVDYTVYDIRDAIVVDTTGRWRDEAGLSQHLAAPGVDRVLLTAPGKGALPNIVHGINHDSITAQDRIITAASCTTNAITPVLKALNDRFGVVHGHVETVHSFTNDQNLTDNYHSGDRRGRSAALNMVLTETGAARAVAKALPELAGKLTGNAIRVPTPDVSMAILSLTLAVDTDRDELNAYLRGVAVDSALSRQIDYIESPEVVSSDFIGSRRAGIVDGLATIVTGRHAVVYVWYDNENGYTHQVMRVLEELTRFRDAV